MRMLVLGAGLQGTACAFGLLQDPDVESVTLADARSDPLRPFLEPFAGDRLRRVRIDATDAPGVRAMMAGHRAVMCALPYYFNDPMTRAALDAGAHFADLGGNTEIVVHQKALDAEARERGLSVVPDCGLAPGMVNILAAEAIRRLHITRSIRIFVGGLPEHPEPPLNYQIVYSLEGALDYYTTPSWVLRQGRAIQVEALTEVESQVFPAPVGTLEAFHTAGGISTMPFAFEGRIQTMEYKTLRYPGHAHLMRAIRDLGLLDDRPISVKGASVVPRDVFIAAVSPQLTKPEGRDLVALRLLAAGTRDGRDATVGFELLDWYDEATGLSAMMRTTGFSLALTGLLQARGRMRSLGVQTPDQAVPFRDYVEGLARYGVRILESEA